jgi:putative spermidine/putrescine transport system substrate-binding protein
VLTRAELLRRALLAGAGLVPFAAACSGHKQSLPVTTDVRPLARLVTQARREGRLTTIGLPPHWAGYGRLMRTYRHRYGVRVRSEFPTASSAEELATMKALEEEPTAPDVLDVTPTFAVSAAASDLFLPYKGATWGTVPPALKDPNGSWVGDYWEAVAFGTNLAHARTAPQGWADLKRPEFFGKVALASDPREAGSGLAAVLAASLANGGSFDDITPGIDFFGDLKQRGNLVLTSVSAVTIGSGETPVTIDWDYLQAQRRALLPAPAKWRLGLPLDGLVGTFYCQAINVKAPHPAAARLWQEFLLSDDGQRLRFESGQHPARFQDLVARGKLPRRLLERFPPPSEYANIGFPRPDQTKTALRVLTDQWAAKVVAVQAG